MIQCLYRSIRWIDALRKYARGDFVNILMGVEDAPEAGIIFRRFLDAGVA